MHNIKIKVCGITREIDAKRAVQYGANMLGFIFYKKSPRYITKTKAKKIISNIPPTVARIGVFVNEDCVKILKTAKELKLDFIQLSGNEKKSDINFLSKAGFKIIKTVAIASQKDFNSAKTLKVDIIHFDTADRKLFGGSGKQFDWNLKVPKSIHHIMLAGGLNAVNVLQGIDKFKPLIVDVNSGVESSPGIKSDRLLKEFFRKVNKLRYGK